MLRLELGPCALSPGYTLALQFLFAPVAHGLSFPFLVHGLLRLSSPEEVCSAWSRQTVCLVSTDCVLSPLLCGRSHPCGFLLFLCTDDGFPSTDSRLLFGYSSHHFSHSSSLHTLHACQKYFYRLIKFHWWDYIVFISLLLFLFLFIWFHSILPPGKHCNTIKHPKYGAFTGTTSVCKQCLLTSLEVGLICSLWLSNEFFSCLFSTKV